MRCLPLRFIIFLSALLALPACVSTSVMETTNEFTAIEKNATILLVEPDLELGMLKASGLVEVRADWTAAGRKNVLSEIRQLFANNGHRLVNYEVDLADGRAMQLIKLHEAVGGTILNHRFLGAPLPSKKERFDWSLGPGVQYLAALEDADYALFLFAQGQYASAGRQALAVGVFVLGGVASTGGQVAFASLVDLKSGDVVWFNVASTGNGTDMRKPEGARKLVRAILKDIPL